MAAPVINPPTPYTTIIPGGFYPGRMIRIRGCPHGQGQRFDINLQTGPGGEIAGEDVAFHASVRLLEGYIARNSFQGGCWQEELGDGGLPILPGQRFDVLILSEEHEYKMAINGVHFCGFPMRVPHTRVTHLMIEGDVQIEYIGWEDGNVGMSAPVYAPPQYGTQIYGQQLPPPPGAYQGHQGFY